MEKKMKQNASESNAVVAVKDVQSVNREAEALQRQIEQHAAELQKCLAELERKKKLSANRATFLAVLDKLEEAEHNLVQDEEFDSATLKLKFVRADNFRDEEVLSVSNKALMLDFVRFIRAKIVDKVEDIELQLLA